MKTKQPYRGLADSVLAHLDTIAVPVMAAGRQARDLAGSDTPPEVAERFLDGAAGALVELRKFMTRAIRRERRTANAVRILVCGAAYAPVLLGANGLVLLGAGVVTLVATIEPAWRACCWWAVAAANAERARYWRECVRDARATGRMWEVSVCETRLNTLLDVTVSDADVRTRGLIALMTRVLASDGAPTWGPEVHERLCNLSELLTLTGGFPEPTTRPADRAGAA